MTNNDPTIRQMQIMIIRLWILRYRLMVVRWQYGFRKWAGFYRGHGVDTKSIRSGAKLPD